MRYKILFVLFTSLGLMNYASAADRRCGLAEFWLFSAAADKYSVGMATHFTFGGGSCPRNSGFRLHQSNDTAYIDNYCNIRWPYPWEGCSRYDTATIVGNTDGVNVVVFTLHEIYHETSPPYPQDTLLNIFDSVFILRTTAVNPAGQLGEVKIYPNPAHDYIDIDRSGAHRQWLQIFNSMGQLLLRRQLSDAAKTRISIADLPAGIYQLRIISDDGTVRRETFLKE